MMTLYFLWTLIEAHVWPGKPRAPKPDHPAQVSRRLADLQFLDRCGTPAAFDREAMLAVMLAHHAGPAARDARLKELEAEAATHGRETVCRALARIHPE